MVHRSAGDQKGDWRGIRDDDAKISNRRRHRGTGCQDHSVYPNKIATFGGDTADRASIASDGALPCIGDQLPTTFLEVFDQELDEARQVDPALARIPNSASVRDGCCIDARGVGVDILRLEQVAVVAVSHLMIMTSVQLLTFAFGVPGQPAREAQPAEAWLLSRQRAIAINAGDPEPMVGLPPHTG